MEADGENELKSPKTCDQIDPKMLKCIHLNGFRYSSKKQAISDGELNGLKKTENYNKFCGTYGTHENIIPIKTYLHQEMIMELLKIIVKIKFQIGSLNKIILMLMI